MGAGHGLRLAVEPADSDVSLALQRAFFAEVASRYPGWEPTSSQSAEPSDFSAPTGTWMVAYLDGRPIGCGGLKGVDSETRRSEESSSASRREVVGLHRRC
jgi:hypothetical protein